MSTTTIIPNTFDFVLPKVLECSSPTEERGLRRDDTRLLVSHRSNNQINHTTFKDIGDFLEAGDVLVVNTSATRNAALATTFLDGTAGRIHLSTPLKNGNWLIEVRQLIGNDTARYRDIRKQQQLSIPGGGTATIVAPYYRTSTESTHIQLWEAAFSTPIEIDSYLQAYGQPIKYKNVDIGYPLSYYQTAFAKETGSTEMPSAGRAFTKELIADLALKGIQFAPVLLHTGVSSLEVNEAPYPEYFEVGAHTADLLNKAKAEGRRIIAVGTTAIRAIESAIDSKGTVIPKSGMTNLFITAERGLSLINAMLTGFHEPKASHLLMMEAMANRDHLALSYQAAIEEEYYWHEFGDLHLIV